MTGKTDFSRGFVGILSAFAVGTLVIVFFFEQSNSGLQERFKIEGRLFVPIPWVSAGGQTIANGLAEFSGEVPQEVALPFRMQTLFSMVLVFVVGPTLLFLGWRTYRLESASVFSKEWIVMVLGGILTFSVALPSIPMAILQRRVSQSLHKAQAVQTNKDEIINFIGGDIQLKVQQYRILPKTLGGGEGSFAGFTLPPDLAETEAGTFSVTAMDSTVTLKATSRPYPNATVTVQYTNMRYGNWEYTGDFE